MKRKALGKGLRSLIPDPPPGVGAPAAAPAASTEGLRQLDIDRIRPNRNQPREAFDEAGLEELAASLRRNGVLQPVIVRPTARGDYELVAGERRWRAAQRAGLLKLPAVVKDVDDDRMLELALIENLQREALDPLEEARAYQTLIDDLDLTQEEIAERVGKQRATVANALRLLNLSTKVQEWVRDGRLTRGHAKCLAGISNDRVQVEVAERILRDGLNVRQTEAIVRRVAAERTGAPPRGERGRDPNVAAAEESLQRVLGTRVRISPARKGGRVELHYYGPEELDRLYQVLVAGAAAMRDEGRPADK